MPALDFSDIPLPDLTSDAYPVVDHAPFCTDDAPTDSRSCHPIGLHRPRLYALPTAALGRLRAPRGHRPLLPPLPPSLGTHCPTIQTDSEVAVGYSDAAMAVSVERRNNDACRPTIHNVVTMPCTRIDPKVQITVGGQGKATFERTSKTTAKRCIEDLLLKLTVPGCSKIIGATPTVQMVEDASPTWTRTVTNPATNAAACDINLVDILKIPCVVPNLSGGSVLDGSGNTIGSINIVSSGPKCNRTFGISAVVNAGGGSGNAAFQSDFIVGGTLPSSSVACAVCYGPGRVVPIIDVNGVLTGTPGSALPTSEYNLINASKGGLIPGDHVFLVEDDLQPLDPGDPRNYYILR